MTGHSEQLNELAAALVKAQAAMRVVEATSAACVEDRGEARSYRYADLASLWAAVRKPLARHGLSVVQTCEPSSRGELRLTTTLLHESGQWLSGTESVPMAVPSAQGYGSALTYARRYGLAAILGVCVDDDDDGAAASKAPALPGAQSQRRPGDQPEAAARARSARSPSGGPRAGAPGGNGSEMSSTEACPDDAWRAVPYNQATEPDLKAFARTYAAARGLESVSSDDIRRDFGIQGKLATHFGATPLGEIVESAESGAVNEAARREPVAGTSADPDGSRSMADEGAEART